MKTVLFDGEAIAPPKIFCIGRNYAKHIAELENAVPESPVIFLKPNVCISDSIILPLQECHYEAEICYLLKSGRIIGAGVGLDLTLRGVQGELKQKGLPWERAKAFKHSAVFGSFVPIDEWQNLTVSLRINDELRQQGDTSLMLFGMERILDELNSVFEIEDYDIIMSGTPEGVGVLKPGDHVEAVLSDSTQNTHLSDINLTI